MRPLQIKINRHPVVSTAWYQYQQLVIKKIARRPESLSQQKAEIVPLSASAAGKRGKRHSPWRKFNPNWFKKTGTG